VASRCWRHRLSGNAKVVKAGLLSVVASGPEAQFKICRTLPRLLGRGVTYRRG